MTADRMEYRPGKEWSGTEGVSVRPCDQRIDKWLFHARFYRTRVLAQAGASAGRIRLNGARVAKPSQAVRPGDILTLWQGGEILALRVVALAFRRGPAPQAHLLYEIVADAPLAPGPPEP